MVGSRNLFLGYQDFVTDRAVLAFGQTGFGAGGFCLSIHNLGVAKRIGVVIHIAVAAGAGIGGVALFGAGGGSDCLGVLVGMGLIDFLGVKEVYLIQQPGILAVLGLQAGDFHGENAVAGGQAVGTGGKDDAVGHAVALGIHAQAGLGVVDRGTGGRIQGPDLAVRLTGDGHGELVDIGGLKPLGIQGDGPGDGVLEQVLREVAGSGEGNEVIVHSPAAAVKDLSGGIVAAIYCLGIAEAHIQQGGIQQPPAVAQGADVGGAGIVEAAHQADVEGIRCGIAHIPGDVTGGSGSCANLIEGILHIRRLAGIMGQLINGSQQDGTVLGIVGQRLVQLYGRQLGNIAEVIQQGQTAVQQRLAQLTGGVGSRYGGLLVKNLGRCGDGGVFLRDVILRKGSHRQVTADREGLYSLGDFSYITAVITGGVQIVLVGMGNVIGLPGVDIGTEVAIDLVIPAAVPGGVVDGDLDIT